jgi:hypothetical protein
MFEAPVQVECDSKTALGSAAGQSAQAQRDSRSIYHSSAERMPGAGIRVTVATANESFSSKKADLSARTMPPSPSLQAWLEDRGAIAIGVRLMSLLARAPCANFAHSSAIRSAPQARAQTVKLL